LASRSRRTRLAAWLALLCSMRRAAGRSYLIDPSFWSNQHPRASSPCLSLRRQWPLESSHAAPFLTFARFV
jgi:hypothetical protein